MKVGNDGNTYYLNSTIHISLIHEISHYYCFHVLESINNKDNNEWKSFKKLSDNDFLILFKNLESSDFLTPSKWSIKRGGKTIRPGAQYLMLIFYFYWDKNLDVFFYRQYECLALFLVVVL